MGAQWSRTARARMITSSPSSRNVRVSPPGEREGAAAAFGDLEQAAEAVRRRRGDGAGPEQVAGPQVAAVAAVVRDELRHRPVEVPRVAERQAMRRAAVAPGRRRVQQHLELEVERAARAGRPRRAGRAAARDRRRAAAAGAGETAPAPRASPPRARSTWRSSWPGTGPSGWYSQPWMSRADQSLSRQKPAMCAGRVADRDGLAQRVAGADPDAELELEVEPPAGSEPRQVGIAAPCAARAAGAPACPTPRSTSCGRGSRSARACSWAAAGCRGGTAGRHSAHGGCRRRSRCSRRSTAGRCSVQPSAGCSSGASAAGPGRALAQQLRQPRPQRDARGRRRVASRRLSESPCRPPRRPAPPRP